MLERTYLKWRGPLAVFAVVVFSAQAAAQSRGLVAEDLHKFRSVGEVRFSPDGKRIVYTVLSYDGPRNPSSELWLWDVDSGRSSPLIKGGGGGSSPRWSPDGKWIAYLGRDGERSVLMVVAGEGGVPRLLAPVEDTNHPLPSTGETLTWSPDSSSIAFVSATPGPETADATGDPIVITRYLYKPTAGEGLTRFNDNRRLHIFVVDIEGKNVRQMTDGTYYEHSIDWSPSGEEILFVSNREPDPDRFFNYDLFALGVSDASIRRLTSTENVEYVPRWSPDGKTIAYEGTRRGLTSSETTMEDTHIWLVGADGGNRREIGASIDNRQSGPDWAPNGTSVYFTIEERGSLNLCRVPVAGGMPEVVVRDIGGRGVAWSVGKGDALAYSTSTRKDMAQLFLKRAGKIEQLTDLNREFLAGKEIAEVEPFTFLSFDGKEVEAFLTHPLGRTGQSKHPLIAVIKGGPHGQDGPHFDHRTQVYAARGWASVKVNYRGSTGYGQGFADAIFGDQDGGEAKDVMYAVDAAVRRNLWIDPDRLGIQGGSYGGQLTMWIITQTNRFRAAIPMYGISNLVSFNYMAYYHDYLAVEFGAFPHQHNLMEELWERSALKHVANVKTPTLIVHGENDNDVPIAESEQFYIGLKDVDVETVMVRYPREGHGIRETNHQIDLLNRSIAWYEKYFPKKAGPATSSR